jgi:hypothetical protein
MPVTSIPAAIRTALKPRPTTARSAEAKAGCSGIEPNKGGLGHGERRVRASACRRADHHRQPAGPRAISSGERPIFWLSTKGFPPVFHRVRWSMCRRCGAWAHAAGKTVFRLTAVAARRWRPLSPAPIRPDRLHRSPVPR